MPAISIELVRAYYVDHKLSEAYDPPSDASVKAAGEEFDAWVAVLKADVRRETLDEARELLDDKATKVERVNDYREGLADGLSTASAHLSGIVKKR